MANDELDDLLMASMKTLDDQVPSGYFEGLPSRILARLEDRSMQTSSSGTNLPVSASGPIPKVDKDEDSGLHDIRNLASSARMRLSSKRVSTSPPIDQDLASMSGSWKAVALPEPAKMVSLPEISQADLKAAQKAEKSSRKSRPSGKIETPVVEVKPEVVAATATAAEAPLHLDQTPVPKKPATVTPIIGARVAQQHKKSNKALIGVLGVGVAAAAGVVLYVTMQNHDKSDASMSAEPEMSRSIGMGSAAPAPVAAPPQEKQTAQIATDNKNDEAAKTDKGEVVVAPDPAPAPVIEEPKKGKLTPPKAAPVKPGKKTVIEVTPADSTKKPTTSKVETKPTKGDPGKEGEPDFDKLLKEAGVDQNKKVVKPKLDKTSLSAGDFKAGMGAVQGKAQGCYNGTQGTASVKLTISPSGTVAKVSVGGQFAGTPVAACIESAVRNATFPPWDGGPQSFNYSYLLSE